MSVRFVLGRAGSGKTRLCLHEAAARLRERADAETLILVPEQAALQTERALARIAPRGGVAGVSVLGFTRLAQRVLELAPISATLLTPSARGFAVRAALSGHAALLRPFGAAAETPGFLRELAKLFEELIREEIRPRQLEESADRSAGERTRVRSRAVAALYERYLAWLGPDRCDSATLLSAACAQLERTEWLRGAHVYLDGFAQFGAQERSLLVALARRCGAMTLTLLADPSAPGISHAMPDSLGLFARTEATYHRLRRALTDAGVAIEPPVALRPAGNPRFAAAPRLASLEAAVALPPRVPAATADASPCDGGAATVRIVRCGTHREELVAAARFIRRSVTDSGGRLRWRDFAVATRDLAAIAHLVQDVFDEHEVPCFLDQRRSLKSHALVRFVASLADAIRSDFAIPESVRLLQSELLPLAREQAELLEQRLREHEKSGFSAWTAPSWRPCRSETRWLRQASSGARPEISPLAELDAARLRVARAIAPLRERARSAAESTGATLARCLYDTLLSLRADARIREWIAQDQADSQWESAELHRLAWNSLCEALDHAHELLGDSTLAFGEFFDLIEAALSEESVGLAPPTLDQVLVGGIERSRHPELKCLWLAAFNEGIFPAPPPQDRLLSRDDRESLRVAGLSDLAVSRDELAGERLLAYIAWTRPSQRLVLSYALRDADGGERLPSPLLAECLRAAPDAQTVEFDAGDQPPTCLAEAGFGILARPGEARWSELRRQLAAEPRLDARLAKHLRGREYSNDPPPICIAGRRRFPEEAAWTTSASEIETYLQCPFRHFARYGLALDEVRGPTPIAIELGQRAHDALARLLTRVMQLPGTPRDWSDDAWLDAWRQTLQEIAAEEVQEELAPRTRFLRQIQGDLLEDVVRAVAQRLRRGGFAPWRVELPFGGEPRPDSAQLPELELPARRGRVVRVRGRIDRVDRASGRDHPLALVLDYKSAVSRLNPQVLTGDRLESLTYLLALRAMGEMRPGGVLLVPLYARAAALESAYVAESDADEQRLHLFRPRGIFTEEAAALLDSSLGQRQSPVAAMRLKSDGTFDENQSRDVVSQGKLTAILDLAQATLLQAADGILSGNVEVAPLVEGQTLACRTCAHRSVCRFEREYNQPRRAERFIPNLPPDDDPSAGESG